MTFRQILSTTACVAIGWTLSMFVPVGHHQDRMAAVYFGLAGMAVLLLGLWMAHRRDWRER